MLRMRDLVDENKSPVRGCEGVEESRSSIVAAARPDDELRPACFADAIPRISPLEDNRGRYRTARHQRLAYSNEMQAAGTTGSIPIDNVLTPLRCDESTQLSLDQTATVSPTGSWGSPTPGLDMLSAQVLDNRGKRASTATSSDTKRRQQLNEASKRCRKRHKDEGVMLLSEIESLQQKVGLLRSKLDAPDLPSAKETKSACYENFRLKRHAKFLEDKLREHERWLRRVRSLMMAAPLFDFAAKHHIRHGDRPDRQHIAASVPELAYLDECRIDCERGSFSRVLVTQRMKEAVRLASENAAALLAEAESQSSRFQRQHVSRGWTMSTTSNNSLLAFRCERHLPIGSLAKDVAFKFWRSLQRDDILRTFIPVIQESVVARKDESCSITRRLLQHSPNGQSYIAVTIESIERNDRSNADNTEAWQISVDVLDDQYLWRLAVEATSDATSHVPPNQASVARTADDEYPHCNSTATGRFTIAFRVLQSIGGGASVEFAGCMQVVDPCPKDTTSLKLLQYLVPLLPVYEELHLV